MRPQKPHTKKRTCMIELYNMLLGTYLEEHLRFSYSSIKKTVDKYEPKKLFSETYDYDKWFGEESDD